MSCEVKVVNASGHDVVYYVYGDPTNGVPLVMVHGRGSCAAQFQLSAELLSATDISVVLVDLPGHGQSTTCDYTYMHRWTLQAMAEAVHGVIVDVKVEKVDLFGHSLGGVVVLEYLKHYGSHVRHLLTMGTHLETESVPECIIRFDRGVRRLLGDSWLYSAYIWAAWCRGDWETWLRLKHVSEASGGHNMRRDLAIVGQIPRYDYRPAIERFVRAGGEYKLVLCEQDKLINAGLSPSLDFLHELGLREVRISGGHFDHLKDPVELLHLLSQMNG